MITVRGLTKIFSSKTVVDDVSFDVHPGRVTGLLGPNGAGKSTTMKLILGLQRPTSGTAMVNGKAYGSLNSPLGEVGAMLDASWVHPTRTAKNHLLSVGLTHGYGRKRVDEVLQLVGLESAASAPAKKLSLGMRQRLGLAGALLGDPQILILDEPVNGLDPDGVIWIRTFLRELAAEGRAVLLSSHLMSEMEQTADHIVVMGRGRVIADGSLREVMGAQGETSVFVRSPRPALLIDVLEGAGGSVSDDPSGALRVVGVDIAEIGDLAVGAGIALHELREAGGTLEDAYLQLVGDDVEYSAGTRAGAR